MQESSLNAAASLKRNWAGAGVILLVARQGGPPVPGGSLVRMMSPSENRYGSTQLARYNASTFQRHQTMWVGIALVMRLGFASETIKPHLADPSGALRTCIVSRPLIVKESCHAHARRGHVDAGYRSADVRPRNWRRFIWSRRPSTMFGQRLRRSRSHVERWSSSTSSASRNMTNPVRR